MKPYKVTEQTPTRLGIRTKIDPSFLLFCVVAILFGVVTSFLMGFYLCTFGVVLITIVSIVLFSLTRDDWIFNKEKRTVIHKTMNVFRQSVEQEYNFHDIQHAFIDEVEDSENSSIVYKSLALKLASSETIQLTRPYYGQDRKARQDLQELMDRINAWVKSGGV